MRDSSPFRYEERTQYVPIQETDICLKTLRADCPYRPCNGDTNMPELTSASEMRTQNLKDRYYVVNDPVANKMMKRHDEREEKNIKAMEPPADVNITTLYIGGLDERITEDSLRDTFYAYGALKSVKVLVAKKCAFVTFGDRQGAEAAAKGVGHGVVVGELRLRVMWGKPAQKKEGAEKGGVRGAGAQGGPSGSVNPAAMPMPFAPPTGAAAAAYPSMDPKAMGARAGDGDEKATAK